MDRTDYEFEYDYEDEPAQDRILWGRIAVLALALVLTFFLGRCTAGGGDSADEVADLTERVDELLEENANLEAQVEAYEAGGTSTGPSAEPASDDASDGASDGASDDAQDTADAAEPTDETGGDDDGDAQTHEVAEGDNLYRIAERYYGNGEKFRLIAEANGLTADDAIQPGQVLRIPPDED